MKNEILSYDIKCVSKNNSFNPEGIKVESLISIGIINDIKELEINRPGSLVAYFKLHSGTTIKVTKNELLFSSQSFDNTIELFDVFKLKYPKARLIKVELEVNEHFIDKKFPEYIYKKFISIEGLDLDVLRYKMDNHMLLIYNCHPNQMHFMIQSLHSFEEPIQFGSLDFEEQLDIVNLWIYRDSFVNKILN